MNFVLISLSIDIQVDKAFVDSIFACGHFFSIVHVVALPVAQLVITAGEVWLAIISTNDHLAHLVDEKGLLACQEPKDGHRVDPLPRDEFL